MDERINIRLSKVRNYFKLNQREFSERIGISQPALAMFETGDRELKNIHIKRICEEFGVDEVWFRTGEGGEEKMFAKVSEDDRYSLNLGKLSKTQNETIINMVNAIAESSPEKLEYIESFMKSCLGLSQK